MGVEGEQGVPARAVCLHPQISVKNNRNIGITMDFAPMKKSWKKDRMGGAVYVYSFKFLRDTFLLSRCLAVEWVLIKEAIIRFDFN